MRFNLKRKRSKVNKQKFPTFRIESVIFFELSLNQKSVCAAHEIKFKHHWWLFHCKQIHEHFKFYMNNQNNGNLFLDRFSDLEWFDFVIIINHWIPHWNKNQNIFKNVISPFAVCKHECCALVHLLSSLSSSRHHLKHTRTHTLCTL